jgi:hypothetical protein
MDNTNDRLRWLVYRVLQQQQAVGKDLLMIAPFTRPRTRSGAGKWQLRVTLAALAVLLYGDDRLLDAGKPLSAADLARLLQQLMPSELHVLDISISAYIMKGDKEYLYQHERAMLALDGYPVLVRTPPDDALLFTPHAPLGKCLTRSLPARRTTSQQSRVRPKASCSPATGRSPTRSSWMLP